MKARSPRPGLTWIGGTCPAEPPDGADSITVAGEVQYLP